MNNIKDNVLDLKTKDLNINYIDFEKFNKIKNKNPSSYYMINGSRKINLPEVSEMSEASAKNIFSEVSPLSVSTLSGGKKKSKDKSKDKSKGKSKAKEELSSTSFTFSDVTVTENSRLNNNPEITSVSGGGSSSKSSSKHSSSSSSSKRSSSSSTSVSKQSRNRYNDASFNNQLNPQIQNKLKGLPENYFDLAPEHLINGMPQGEMGMPQGEMGMPQGDMGMPQGEMGMPQGEMGMSQMNMSMPQMNMPMNMPMQNIPSGLGQVPPMPADMQQIAMNHGAMPQMQGQMHPQLNVPTMNNPMASFMGMGQGQGMQMGGGAKPIQKYKLTLDKFFF
jgi:hypothetical protein